MQACTEMVMPMCSDGVADMFEPQPWNYDDYKKKCLDQFHVPPQPAMPLVIYGGKNIAAHSNIVFR